MSSFRDHSHRSLAALISPPASFSTKAVIWLWVALTVLGGCGSRPASPVRCASEEDCAHEQICRARACVDGGETDEDDAAVDPPPPCLADEQCTSTGHCEIDDNECQQCADDSQCAQGWCNRRHQCVGPSPCTLWDSFPPNADVFDLIATQDGFAAVLEGQVYVWSHERWTLWGGPPGGRIKELVAGAGFIAAATEDGTVLRSDAPPLQAIGRFAQISAAAAFDRLVEDMPCAYVDELFVGNSVAASCEREVRYRTAEGTWLVTEPGRLTSPVAVLGENEFVARFGGNITRIVNGVATPVPRTSSSLPFAATALGGHAGHDVLVGSAQGVYRLKDDSFDLISGTQNLDVAAIWEDANERIITLAGELRMRGRRHV